MRPGTLAALALTLPACCAPAAAPPSGAVDPEPPGADLARLRGTWVLSSSDNQGAPPSAPKRLVIAGGTLTYLIGGRASAPQRLRVPRPGQMDVGPAKAPDFLGLYRLKDGTLTITYSGANGGRPRAYSGRGRGDVVEVYQAEKR
jgi:uncharacterized protein (TIGR03067 family)